MKHYYITFQFIDNNDEIGYSSTVLEIPILLLKQTHKTLQEKFNLKTVLITNFIEITKEQYEEAK